MIFELESADHAPQSVTQGPAFAPAAVPLPDYPEEKNCRKKNQQIDRDQGGQTDADHGAVEFGEGLDGMMTSLPHWMVAVVQSD